MLIGSSLGRQLAPYMKGYKIFSKGKINVGYVEECLLGTKRVDRIILVTGNDIFPSKLCMGHKCLEILQLRRDYKNIQYTIRYSFYVYT